MFETQPKIINTGARYQKLKIFHQKFKQRTGLGLLRISNKSYSSIKARKKHINSSNSNTHVYNKHYSGLTETPMQNFHRKPLKLEIESKPTQVKHQKVNFQLPPPDKQQFQPKIKEQDCYPDDSSSDSFDGLILINRNFYRCKQEPIHHQQPCPKSNTYNQIQPSRKCQKSNQVRFKYTVKQEEEDGDEEQVEKQETTMNAQQLAEERAQDQNHYPPIFQQEFCFPDTTIIKIQPGCENQHYNQNLHNPNKVDTSIQTIEDNNNFIMTSSDGTMQNFKTLVRQNIAVYELMNNPPVVLEIVRHYNVEGDTVFQVSTDRDGELVRRFMSKELIQKYYPMQLIRFVIRQIHQN